jgi:polar amino acid transport system permease protein
LFFSGIIVEMEDETAGRETAVPPTGETTMAGPEVTPSFSTDSRNRNEPFVAWREFPWWLVAIFIFLGVMTYLILTDEEINQAFVFIFPGITTTLYLTLGGFGLALVFGLLAGLGRISQNRLIRNIAITYVEFIRGVPTLVLILTLAFVIVPAVSASFGIDNRDVSIELRAILALAIIYGAFLAEIFRAGIESISKGQMEAARSLGMTTRQAMQYIILPQAIRNISPALGNDFIAMLKDSSLASVLAVRELTQRSRLHAGSTFRFPEAYLVIVFLYLAMTITLSLLLRWYERRLRVGER